ncbi:MAG: UvrB/UvrC motif-containing protein [Phycisphaerae bacterium]
MTLDLNDLISDWPASREEISARMIQGQAGEALIQLRIELGVLQMFPDDRPDGQRFRGLPSASEYVRRQLRRQQPLEEADWAELVRELHQTNYRRLALTSMAESAIAEGDGDAARQQLTRALRDVDLCVASLRLLERDGRESNLRQTMVPTLVFNRARLRCRLHIVEQQFDDAIEVAKNGAQELEDVLSRFVGDEASHDRDAGVEYLRQLERRLREEKNIPRTLYERLDDAVEREDFEEASRLRDMLDRRNQRATDVSTGAED